MYISNNSNIGMATLLQQNKNCMKTLTTTASAATNGGNSNNIGVGGGGVGGVSCNSSSNNNNVISGVVGATGGIGGVGGSLATTTLGSSNISVLPQITQTILLRNGATTGAIVLTNGASGFHPSTTHTHHQQPKQVLHAYGVSTLQQIRLQQHQQQQQPQKSSSNPSNSISTSAPTSAITTTTTASQQHFSSVPNGNSGGGGGNTNNNNTNHVSTQLQQHQHVFATTLPSTPDAAPIAAADEQEPEPEIDIVINNVVCSFSVRCHLNLREIALNGFNVEYRRENGMVTMKLRRPYTTASIWSSGRITCTGATSEEQAKIAARRYARCLEKLGFRARFHNFRVVNVLGTCSMPWAIKIVNFSERYKKEASYEPELHPGVTYKLRVPKATLKIFSTGSITVTAASVANVQLAIEHIFPLVYEFRKKRSPEELEQLRLKQLHAHNRVCSSAVAEIVEVDSETINDIVTHSPPFVTTDADARDEVGTNSNAATSASAIACTKLLTATATAGAGKRAFATTDMLSNMKRKRKRLDNGGGSDVDYDEDGLEIENIDDPEIIDESNIIVCSEYDDLDDLIEEDDDDL